MVLTLIRDTRKTTLDCMSSLSICLVPNVHCKRSQQLRTICTCVTDYTHKELLAIRRIFSLVDMINNIKFSNCPSVFEIGVVWQ